jgi:hypothetical protein
MSLVFVPLDIVEELGGDTGVLLFTGLVLAMLMLLRRRARRFGKVNPSFAHPLTTAQRVDEMSRRRRNESLCLFSQTAF